MYEPYTDDKLEEKYHGQMDDISDPQYAYEYGMTIYEIGCRYDFIDLDYAGLVIYWLLRYLSQEETQPECTNRSRYIVTKLFRDYPELREEFREVNM